MHKKSQYKKSQYKPRLVEVRDRHGDELTLPRLAQELIDGDRAAARATTVREDLQATRRRPLDAPMATREPHAVDRTTLLLARVLAWAGGLVLIGAGIMLATWLAVGRL